MVVNNVSSSPVMKRYNRAMNRRLDLLDQALMDAHLVGIPCLGTFTVGGLSGADLEILGWQADGTLDAQVL